MAKINISNNLMKRIECASENNSKVATALLTLLREGKNKDVKELTGGKEANYFDSVRLTRGDGEARSICIMISYCSKDVHNPNFPDVGNPDAPYYQENRTRTSPVQFAKLFPSIAHGEFTELDYTYFDSAIRLASKVHIKISRKMYDIEEAYLCGNYTSTYETGCGNLHNSCMRYDDRARDAADFYTHVAGASILVAKDNEGHILGRAIVWRDVDMTINSSLYCKASFIDRVYFSYNFVHRMMREYATSNGIQFRKTKNDYSSVAEFTALSRVTFSCNGENVIEAGGQIRAIVKKPLPAVKWHKYGAPYCDTMDAVCYADYHISGEIVRRLVLTNERQNALATLKSTRGRADRTTMHICPCCGELTSSNDVLCGDCEKKHCVKTVVGSVMRCSTKVYKGKAYPSFLLTDTGKPRKPLADYLTVESLY